MSYNSENRNLFYIIRITVLTVIDCKVSIKFSITHNRIKIMLDCFGLCPRNDEYNFYLITLGINRNFIYFCATFRSINPYKNKDT